MKDLSDLLSITATFDIRVETLAATLLAQPSNDTRDFQLEDIVVAPVGHGQRRSKPEVKAVKKKYYEHDTALLIETNRKGLYDTLPERLFLRLDEEYDTPLKRTRAIKGQIKEARKFFLPYEQAMYHPRIEAEQKEQQWTEDFPDFIEKLWGLPDLADCLDKRQRFLLCHLLPEAYRIAGNWELTGLCFEAILQKPVDLNIIPPLELQTPKGDVSSDELRLGEDAVIGSTFKDDMPALEVCVKNINLEELPDYLEGGKRLKLLEEFLYSYFLPLDVTVVTNIMVTEEALSFNLGRDILGYNIKLAEHIN